MSHDIATTAKAAEAASKEALKPLSEFLKKQIENTGEQAARASFEAHLAGLNGVWGLRLKASQRAKGMAHIQRIRQMMAVPELRIKDNRQQYASKLQQLGGAA